MIYLITDMKTKYFHSFAFVKYIIILQICLLNLVKSEFFIPWDNVTTDTTFGRLKRSPIDKFPIRLNITIRYEHGEEITLIWMKVYSYLANKNLPVIMPLIHKKSEVMEDVGEFLTYYDKIHCSAVIYFKKLQCFYGVIGTDYYIQSLPYNFDSRGDYRLQVVGEPYIVKRSTTLSHIDPRNLFDPIVYTDFEDKSLRQSHNFYSIIDNQDNSRGNQNDTTTQDPLPPNYYCEILIFVARDIVDYFLNYYGVDHYIEWIVRYYIVYFHTTDMIFRDISNIHGIIRMNIAKICIEDNSTPFSFLSNDILQFADITTQLIQYFTRFSKYYPEDSFDYVFIHTSRSIWDGSVQRHGLTKRSTDLLHARMSDQFYNAVPITIMRYETFYADYITSVHAMGGIFNINIDPDDQTLTTAGQCHSVMQSTGPRCNNCFQWSEASRNQLNIFFRTNTNRCFFLNYPRSLFRPGPIFLCTPTMQCQCFGYHSYKVFINGQQTNLITHNECKSHLICGQYINESIISINSNIRPFDGMPCRYGKICWNRECLLL